MGGVKDQQEIEGFRYDIATQIAISSGVLSVCENHNDQVLAGQSMDDGGGAYALGTTKFNSGELSGEFESLEQMKDFIKSAIDNHNDIECLLCKKAKSE